MSACVRFAPSPTGYLHVGNARVALVNWLFARARGGRFILRLDDTDEERTRPEYERAIEEDLAWLGLDWEIEVRQSARGALYERAFESLADKGRVYRCYETADELAARRRGARTRGRPPVYDRAALALSVSERRRLEASGRRPYWRFLLPDGAVAWDDMVRGPVEMPGGHVSDPVVRRADGRATFIFAGAVDEVDLGISHVIRGEDHLTNTAVQLRLIEALGAAPPRYGHLSMLVDADGRGLSKRAGGLTLRALRARGIEPMAVNSLLARLGTPAPVVPALSLEALVQGFEIGRFGRSPARLDRRQLERLNARLTHALPFSAVAARLEAMGLEGADEAFWNTVRPNLETIDQARQWWRVSHGRIRPLIEDPDYLALAARLLPPEPWGPETWDRWLAALRGRTGRHGGALVRPLRLALTGAERGPEMKNLLPLVGRARALARLRGEAA